MKVTNSSLYSTRCDVPLYLFLTDLPNIHFSTTSYKFYVEVVHIFHYFTQMWGILTKDNVHVYNLLIVNWEDKVTDVEEDNGWVNWLKGVNCMAVDGS